MSILSRLSNFLLIISCVLSVWIGAAYGFHIKNIKCTPLFSYECISKLIEDTVLLRWVDDPGTFILGCIAAISTGIGAILLYNQVRQADRLEDFRRLQKHKAQRALMPLRLSDTSRYVEKSIRSVEIAILRYEAARISRTALLDDREIPILPDEPINFFSDFIEYAQVKTTLIENMISMIQYQSSRIAELSDRQKSRSIVIYNLYSYYIEYCIIHCIINSMYNYGRGRDENMPTSISWESVIKNISFRSISGDHLDNILSSAYRISESQGENVVIT